jgi:hypothetical protein
LNKFWIPLGRETNSLNFYWIVLKKILITTNIFIAVSAGLKEIWVFLIAAQAVESQKWLEQVREFSKLNETVVNSQDISAFLKFVNKKTSDLTSVVGIGKTYAKKIRDNSPYRSLEELQNKLGQKRRPLNWIRAFKQL